MIFTLSTNYNKHISLYFVDYYIFFVESEVEY